MGNSASAQKDTSAEFKKDPTLSQEYVSDEYKKQGNASEDYSEHGKASDSASVSDEHIEQIHFCDPCKSAGENNRAVGFCVDCKECLCRICYKSHSRDKLCQDHKLLSREAIPGQAAIECDFCKRKGEKREAEGFCGDCKEYLCDECFMGHSRNKLARHHILYNKSSLPVVQPVTAKKHGMPDITEYNTYSEEYRFVKELGIKLKKEESDCYITGLALVSDNELVVTDEHNRCVKLLDMKNSYILKVPMESVPNRITTISYDQVAVVLRDECKIKILRTSNQLSTIRSLNTDGICVDIYYANKKLYVSFRKPVKFQVLDLTGTIKRTIIPGDMIVQNCGLPSRIAVSPDESLIFMTDWKRNTLMSMDMNGQMVSLYPTPLPEPGDILFSPFGFIYICIKGKHMIYKMTLDFQDVTVIVGPNCLVKPFAFSLDESKKHLYVSSGSSRVDHRNVVKVFKWT